MTCISFIQRIQEPRRQRFSFKCSPSLNSGGQPSAELPSLEFHSCEIRVAFGTSVLYFKCCLAWLPLQDQAWHHLIEHKSKIFLKPHSVTLDYFQDNPRLECLVKPVSACLDLKVTCATNASFNFDTNSTLDWTSPTLTRSYDQAPKSFFLNVGLKFKA